MEDEQNEGLVSEEPNDLPEENETPVSFIGELPEAGFEETLEDLDTRKIKPSCSVKKSSVINANFIIRMFLLVLCASLFMYCVYSIASRIADDTKSRQLVEELIETIETKSEVNRLAKVRSSQPSSMNHQPEPDYRSLPL